MPSASPSNTSAVVVLLLAVPAFAQLPEGPGKAETEKLCSQCHEVERSIAPRQHLQISQARAIETGRYMLRATNTGMTAIVDERGAVLKVAPQFETATLTGTVRGYTGLTPYIRWGDYLILAIAMVSIGAALLFSRRSG